MEAERSSFSSQGSKKPVIISIITLIALITISSFILFTSQFAGKATAGIGDVVTVDINSLVFSPAEIIIDVGDTVIWTNNHDSDHHIVSDDGTTFNSNVIVPGGRFEFTFTSPGVFEYRCILHPGLRIGEITVRAAVCGNDQLEVGEQCDGAFFLVANDTCAEVVGSGSTGILSCDNNCRISSTNCTEVVTCGNGVLDAGEACDLSSTPSYPASRDTCAEVVGTGSTGSLGCSTDCQSIIRTSCSVISTCGNGVLDASEACDATSTSSYPASRDTCAEVVGAGSTGSLSCSTDCQNINSSACSGSNATCSNGALNYPTCTNCNSTSILISDVCVANCNNNATNPPTCNLCSTSFVLVGNECIANCTNGALDPPTCESCPVNQTLGEGDRCFNNCGNLANNPPFCNQCPQPLRMVNNFCHADCENNAENPPVCDQCSGGRALINGQCVFPCLNGAVNPSSCTTCSPGRVMRNNVCTLQRACTNGATNSPACDSCEAGKILFDDQCVNPCTNGATNPSTCSTCRSGQSLINGQCTSLQQQQDSGRTQVATQTPPFLPPQLPSSTPEIKEQKPSFEEYVQQYKTYGVVGGLGILVIIIIIIIIFVIRKGKIDPQLKSYISQQKLAGYSKDMIEKSLLHAGWDHKQVKKGLK